MSLLSQIWHHAPNVKVLRLRGSRTMHVSRVDGDIGNPKAVDIWGAALPLTLVR